MLLVKYGSISRQRLVRSMNKFIGAYADKLSLVMLIRYKGASCRGGKLKKKARKQVVDPLQEASILLPLFK